MFDSPPIKAAEDEPEDKENASPSRNQDEDEDEDEVDDDEDEVDDDDLFGLCPLKKHTVRRIVADEEDENEDATVPSKDENVPPLVLLSNSTPSKTMTNRLGRQVFHLMLMFNSSTESLVDGSAEKEPKAGDMGDGFDMTDADAETEIEGDGFTQLFVLDSKPAGFHALRRREALDDMDPESQKLLPRADLSTHEMQKEDTIFGQHQIVRAVIERKERQKALQAPAKKYLNEDGVDDSQAQRTEEKDKEKEKQMREFVQDQADESNEDKIIGFGDVREDENDDLYSISLSSLALALVVLSSSLGLSLIVRKI
ncbi:hypothetical protein FRC04_006577 [Tulasnella sp. 424]|nr:hypothetical protein FRC04_006577 [Tulasnella sp. 424]